MTVAVSNLGIELGKAVLAIVVLVVASGTLLLLLGAGPLGWLVVVPLGLGVRYALSSWYGADDEDAAERLHRANCPNCGARIAADSDRCDRCNEPFSLSE